MKVLDLFCGAGGAAMGLHRAWPHVEITGVDIKPQTRYPFTFVQADAMTFPLEGYDFIWASPPCQAYSQGCIRHREEKKYPRLLAPTRKRLMASGIPYCIENVVMASGDFQPNLMLCGSMFGLGVVRHRLFETTSAVLAPPHVCYDRDVNRDVVSVTGHSPRGRWYASWSVTGKPHFEKKIWERAMGIDWMLVRELTEAIPPAYSEFIARAHPTGADR